MRYAKAAVVMAWVVLSVHMASGAQYLSAERYGNGGNAAFSSSSSFQSNNLYNYVNVTGGTAGQTGLALGTSGNPGNFTSGVIVLIHQTRGSGAGNWELNKIANNNGYSAGGGTITLTYPLSYSYTSGAQMVYMVQFSSFTLNAGHTFWAAPWDGTTGGIVAILCNGTTTINGTIDVDSRGFRGSSVYTSGGGTGYQGEGTAGPSGISYVNNGNGGGGGDNEDGGTTRSGGGGGGNGTAGGGGTPAFGGTAAWGGAVAGDSTLTNIVFGGAGGNTRKFDNTYGSGGYGGGLVIIISKVLVCNGTIRANGGNGGATSYNGIGGGAGAGGSILVMSDSATLGGTVQAVGGTGGAQPGDARGGNGGVGRISVHYGTSWGGSSNPGFSVVQDNLLIPNIAPTAFSLSGPANASYSNTNRPTFTWQASSDPESLPITYTFKLSTNSAFTEPVYRTSSGITGPSHTPAAGQEIANGTYYWRVIASDGAMSTSSNDTRTITIDTVPPSAPTMTANLLDLATRRISAVYGSGENGSTLSFQQWDANTEQYVTVPGSVVWNGNYFTFTPSTALDSGTPLYLSSTDAASNTSISDVNCVSFDVAVNVFMDTVTTASNTGSSMRLEKDTSYEFKMAVNDGDPVTITAKVRRNAAYSGPAPQLSLWGLGIAGAGAAMAGMTGPAEAWEALSVTGTPDAAGVLHLRIETFSTGDDAIVWIDDITVSQ